MLCKCCRKRDALDGYLKCGHCLKGQPKRHLLTPEQLEAKRAQDRLTKLARRIRRGEPARLNKPTPGALALVATLNKLDELYIPPVGLSDGQLRKQSKRQANERYRKGQWPNVKFNHKGEPE